MTSSSTAGVTPDKRATKVAATNLDSDDDDDHGTGNDEHVDSPPSDNVFSDDDLRHIAGIVFRTDTPSTEQFKVLKKFFASVCVHSFADLEYQDAGELLSGAQLSNQSIIRGTYRGRLRNFLTYGSKPKMSFSKTTTMATIMKELTSRDASTKTTSDASAASDPNKSSSHSSSSFKYQVPQLKPFSGNEEDFWEWFDETYDEFGAAGLSKSLTDQDYFKSNPELAEAGFYALSKALKQGHAKAIPEQVRLASGRTAAFDLYTGLRKHFDTPATRTHHTLHSFKKLNNIRLDLHTTSTEFLAEWDAIMAPLERNNSPFAKDRDMLYCFLLQAIVSDAFADVRGFMFKKPNEPIKDYLYLIRQHNTTHKIHEGTSPTNAEGELIVQQARRAHSGVTFRSPPDTHFYDPNQSSDGSGKSYPKWHIPYFPKGWSTVLNRQLWARLQAWRKAAHGTRITPKELDAQYGVKANKPYTPQKRMRRVRNEMGESVLEEYQPGKRMKICTLTAQPRRQPNGKTIWEHPTITEVPV